jgi:hypothetical protein
MQRPSNTTRPSPNNPLGALRLLQSRLNVLLSSNTAATPAALEKLLVEADGLESGGDEQVRTERRKLVKEVERELGRLEKAEEAEVESEGRRSLSSLRRSWSRRQAHQRLPPDVQGYSAPQVAGEETGERAGDRAAGRQEGGPGQRQGGHRRG